ncbi:MAG: cellulase family glycosylhydrolase, partial [Candidatus Omnitrophica bacterium]|nr:cellulase family glycosylhydrolase [Candidatus Omnitrophota bacterium]
MKMKVVVRAILGVVFLASVNGWAAPEAGHGDFIYREGPRLMLHGKPFRYVGANTYYMMVYSAAPEMRKYIDEVFADAKAMGVKVIRAWAFNDGKRQWNVLQTAPGSYKEGTFAGLDRVIAKAKENGIYLILTFGNNWHHYGGAKQYVDWSSTAKKKEHDEFFTDENCKRYFKDHISALLNRENTITGIKYKDDPTILAW